MDWGEGLSEKARDTIEWSLIRNGKSISIERGTSSH